MNANDEISVLLLIKEHFSKATDGDGKIVWEDVRGYGLEDVQKAIIEHRREKGSQAWRPDPKRVRQLAFGNFRQRLRKSQPGPRIVDQLRAPVPDDDRSRFHDMKDQDVIIHHYGESWIITKDTFPDPKGLAISRAYILQGCRQALLEIGWEWQKADDTARDCVELKSNEKIPKVGVFKALSPLKKSIDALKDLALAVHLENVQEGGSGI